MDDEQGSLDLVRVMKWRHVRIRIGRFPEASLLRLETKRRERAIVRAAPSDACAEELGAARKDVRRHERAV